MKRQTPQLRCVVASLTVDVQAWLALEVRDVSKMTGSHTLPLVIEFGGGAELLFDKKKINNVNLPLADDRQWNIRELLVWIKTNLLKERLELFMQDDSVRPGILVLVNDVDWELMDTLNYVLKANDRIVFISTLHGG